MKKYFDENGIEIPPPQLEHIALRDKFAVAALTGLITAENATKITSLDQYQERLKVIGIVAYEMADACLGERQKERE